jgi:protein TonB
METSNKSIEKFNELIFENRHKEYGAYAIRSSYNDSVTRALIITSSLFLLLTFTAVWFTKNKIEIVIPNTDPSGPVVIPTKTIEVTIIPEKKNKETKSTPAPKTTSGQLKAADEENKTQVKPNEQMTISKNTTPGDSADTNGKNEPYTPATIPAVEKKPEIVKVPDKMPELKGMDKFIADHLHYPRVAVANGTSGIVYISFVVEPDGSISNIELMKGIGDGCEQEAIRVVGMFPKWIPGIYEGKPARVQCNLPVKFRLKND